MSAKKQSHAVTARKGTAKKSAAPSAALPKRKPKHRTGSPLKLARDTKAKPPARASTAAKRASSASSNARQAPKKAAGSNGSRAAGSKATQSRSAAPASKAPSVKTGAPAEPKAALPGKVAAGKSAAAKTSLGTGKPGGSVADKRAKGPKRPPTLEELKAMQTDEVWALYRKARKAANDADWIELLRNALMELHYPLVRHIAERLLQTLTKSLELDDLISAGVFGLMDAIRGFDPDRGIKFKTYCTTRIRGSILDQLRSQDWVPRLVRLKAGRIDKAFQKLRGEYGREPTHAELANYLRMDHEELLTEIDESRARQITSINERWNEHDDDSSMEKIDVVEDASSVDPIKEMNKRDMLKYITRSLTHKEQFIIEQYYQIGHPMREIGEMLALTESRVCQIHSNVMSRLKSLLGPKSTGISES